MTRFGKSDDAFTAVVSGPRDQHLTVWLVDDVCMSEPGNDGDIMIVAPYRVASLDTLRALRKFDPVEAALPPSVRVPRSYHRWRYHRWMSVDVSKSSSMRYAVLAMVGEDWHAVGPYQLMIPAEHCG